MLELIILLIGLILMYLAGKQDLETRTPLLLIPSLILIGLAHNILSAGLITILSIIILLLPKETNKIMGKADLLLFAGIFIIFIFAQNLTLTILIFIALLLTVLNLVEINEDKKNAQQVPLIYYFSKNFTKIIMVHLIIFTIITVLIIVFSLIGGV
jgi:hypothetical protein